MSIGISEHEPGASNYIHGVWCFSACAGLVVLCFVLPHVVGEDGVYDSIGLTIYTLLIYSHCLVWFLFFISDLAFSFHHR